MAHDTISYLKTHRRRSGLTQQEVAFLLGYESSQVISRYEGLNRTPSLRATIAYLVIFDLSVDMLLPGAYREVERATVDRLLKLIKRINEQPSSTVSDWKADFLRQSIARLGDQSSV